jgi:CRP/FNR family transcriptional regulator
MEKQEMAAPAVRIAPHPAAQARQNDRARTPPEKTGAEGRDWTAGVSTTVSDSVAVDVAACCPDCPQRHCCLPEGLASGELRRLGNLLSGSRTIARQEYLFRAGDSLDCLYALRSGVVKLMCTASNGDEQVLEFCLPGEILGLEALGAESCVNSAVAIETATVCQLPIDRLERMCGEIPGLQRRLHLLFARQIVNSQMALTVIGKGKAEAGLASLLLQLARRLKAQGYSEKEFNLSMSRTDIANYLGIAVETVSRMFTRFHRKGVLRVDKRNIVILEPDCLRALAGEETAAGTAGRQHRYQEQHA